MDQTTAGFVATISIRSEHPATQDTRSAREEFWRPIQQRTEAVNRELAESIDRLENNVIASFPTVLHGLLMQHFQTPSVRFKELVTAHPRELYAVFFGVVFEGYSSAVLAIDVGGVKELAELCRGNIDTFTMLMEAFVPAAFANVVPSTHGRADFIATIAPTAELARVFTQVRTTQAGASVPSAGTGSPTGEGSGGWLAKVPRALVATAFSLLTPVLLSLVVLYCAAQLLMQDRSELSKHEALFASEQQDLCKTEYAAVVDLQRQNVDLIRLLRAPPASPLIGVAGADPGERGNAPGSSRVRAPRQ